jgi:hypothetical protein
MHHNSNHQSQAEPWCNLRSKENSRKQGKLYMSFEMIILFPQNVKVNEKNTKKVLKLTTLS